MTARRRMLLVGAAGQVGVELRKSRPAGVDLVGLDRAQLDIGDRDAVMAAVAAAQPAAVINAAAYTAVDRAEAEPELAYRTNRDGAGHVAAAAHRHGARLLHVSTDYVFDGAGASPYRPEDPVHPLSVYGASKLAGEQRVAEASGGAALIVRTAWVYSAIRQNFARTMLALLASRQSVRVVADQTGTPTHAGALAAALWALLERPELRGVLHWTEAGTTTWHGFAVAIRECAERRWPQRRWAAVEPIATRDYPTAARRPAFSVLDKSATWRAIGTPPDWRDTLAARFGEFEAPPAA